MKKFEEVNLKFSEIIESMSKKEKKQYEKDNSLDKVVAYKIILDLDKECDLEKVDKEFSDLVLVTKEKKSYIWYFSNVKEEDLEELIKKIEEFSISEEDKEEAKRLEEEARIAEEQRLQQEKEENELEIEIKKIFANKEVIREIKEKCEDIEQLIYRLKNQVNFMTFYYLVTRKMDISDKEKNFEKYSKVFDWYMDLSQKYVECRKIEIEYNDISKKGFENQLNKVKSIHDMLYSAWKMFQAEKKFSEEYFKSIEKKIPNELIQKILSEKIFEFGKEIKE